MNRRYDLVVVGGGTAALVAAQGAAGIGARVALVERARTGGDCLWTGCVPSKALLAAAAAAHDMRHADRHGLEPVDPVVDLGRVMRAVQAAQQAIAPQDSPERLHQAGVEVVPGHGRFVAPGRLAVGDRVLRYRAALIATGARPVLPPVDGLAEAAPLTSDTVWELDHLPDRLLVLGGGPIGCELGQAFARLGACVTIVEAQAGLLPGETEDVGRVVSGCLEAEGVRVLVGSTARRVTRAASGSGFRMRIEQAGGELEVPFDRVLVAVGRAAVVEDLGLEVVGVACDERGHVAVDDRLRTSARGIYAAGDVTGVMPFTHVAAHQARVAVTNALLLTRRRASYTAIPWVTFTDPEVARVGLDAASARARWGRRAVVQRFELRALDRAITQRATSGYAEIVGDRRGRLVGATIVGHAAGESIAELTAWVQAGATIATLSQTVHAYPTFSEGASRAADDVLRARYFSARVRRLTRPVLGLLRLVDRPRARGR